MATIAEALQVALQYQSAGHLREAEQIYRQILQADSSQVESWNNLGDVCWSTGRLDDAATCFQRVLRLQPGHAIARKSLDAILRQRSQGNALPGNLPQSQETQMNAQAYNRQGIALFHQGQLNEAMILFQKTLELWPDNVECTATLATSSITRASTIRP